MTVLASSPAISASLTRTALFLAVAMAVTVLTALGFQHIGGYIPCKLCLEQRWPFYIGAPLMALAALSGGMGVSPKLTRGLLVLGGIIMAVSLYLGAKHAGVEWGFWAGPTDCGAVAGVDTGGKGVLDALDTVVPPSCDKAALRVLGLSFAGWNAVVSFVLMLVAFRGAAKG
jgi:disulfide bond formation protein DsbB